MGDRSCLAIVLAAGEGTRMRSQRPKVLHEVAGRSLLAHVLTAVRAAGGTATAVVIGPGADAVAAEAARVVPDAEMFVQAERRGTAHAVLAAKAAIERGADDVLVIFGDTPLIRPQTLRRMRDALATGTAVAVLAFRPQHPTGYGRLVLDGGELGAIREALDGGAAGEGGDGGGRDGGGAGDGLSLGWHHVGHGRDGRAVRRVRAGRHGRGQCGDPFVLASRPRACGQAHPGWTLRTAAAGGAAR